MRITSVVNSDLEPVAGNARITPTAGDGIYMEFHVKARALGCVLRSLGLVLLSSMLLHAVAFAQVNIPPGGTTSIPPGGTMSLPCTSINVQGNLNVNSGQVNTAGGVSIAAGGTIDGGSGTINNSGYWINSGTFIAGTGTVVFSGACTAAQIVISGNTVFNNLTILSTTGGTFVIPAGSNITVNGVLTIQGSNGQPVNLISSSGQTAIINLGPQATVVNNNASLNNVQIGATPTAIPALDKMGLMLLISLVGAFAIGLQGKRPTR